jgi:hypothetical protein
MTERRDNQPRPRFHPQTILPVVPEGMTLVKFFGEPAVIPIRRECEPLSRRSEQFTDRQLEALVEMDKARKRRIRGANGGAPYRLLRAIY